MKCFVLILALGLFSQNAFAVKKADCPASMKINVTDLKAQSLNEVYKAYADNQGLYLNDLEDDEKKVLSGSVEQVNTTQEIYREWPLNTKKNKNGVCVYEDMNDDGVYKFEKAELYTKAARTASLSKPNWHP